MKAIPSHLLQLRVLSEVPRSEFSELVVDKSVMDEKSRLSFLKILRQKKKPEQTNVQRSKTTHYSFNSAVWLSFARPPVNPISFWLVYRDEAGERAVLVDEHSISESTSAMLSGTAELDFMGEIQFIKACCAGFRDDESFRIDELYVQREKISVDGSLKTA